MDSRNSLSSALPLLLDHLQESKSNEQRRAFELASGAAAFLSRTGQVRRFERFHETGRRGHLPPVSFARELCLLERACARAPSASEREPLLVALSALAYVESSGQQERLEEYLNYWRGSTLPPVIAVFNTRTEAEAWLEAHPIPPTGASVLIADEYHLVLASRERRAPPFAQVPVIAQFMKSKLLNGLPPAVASFDTRAQAEAWHASVPEPPRHAFIMVNGECHVAAYWKNVNHRALYPFSLVDELK